MMREIFETFELQAEATYERDKKFRRAAESFYEKLSKYLKKNLDKLVPRRDGGFSVHAMEFWSHPKARNFGVVFLPKRGSTVGGIGKAGKNDVLVLHALKGPHDPSHLPTRIRKDVVIHEMIHFLDPGLGRGRGGAAARASGGEKSYYNEPGEWNAYWQEGASKFERMLGSVNDLEGSSREKAMRHLFGDGSLGDALSRAGKFWDEGFLEQMSRRTKRKFDKRFSQLWKAAKERGDL